MKVNIDDGLLDEVFEDLPGNSAARNQPAPRSPSKVGGQRQKMVEDKNKHKRWDYYNDKDNVLYTQCIHQCGKNKSKIDHLDGMGFTVGMVSPSL